jgi:hypothetical protein
LRGRLSTGPKDAQGEGQSRCCPKEGRVRRIAELAPEGKKINTCRRQPKPTDVIAGGAAN